QQIWPILTQSAATRIQADPATLAKLLKVPVGDIRASIELIDEVCTLENCPSPTSMTIDDPEPTEFVTNESFKPKPLVGFPFAVSTPA
ncbi:hypothetical protein ABTM58_20185, partial [Acinetobacter baumannii]